MLIPIEGTKDIWMWICEVDFKTYHYVKNSVLIAHVYDVVVVYD